MEKNYNGSGYHQESVFLCHNDVLSTNKIKVLNSAVLGDGDFTSVNDFYDIYEGTLRQKHIVQATFVLTKASV